MKQSKSIADTAAATVIACGVITGFVPTANSGQMMLKQGSCPFGTNSEGGGYCKARDSSHQYGLKGESCPSGTSSMGGGYFKVR